MIQENIVIQITLKGITNSVGPANNVDFAETGLAQWIEHRPADWKVPGSILVKCMYLGCRHIPRGVCRRKLINVSLSH